MIIRIATTAMTVQNMASPSVDLVKAYSLYYEPPTILVYRKGWCPLPIIGRVYRFLSFHSLRTLDSQFDRKCFSSVGFEPVVVTSDSSASIRDSHPSAKAICNAARSAQHRTQSSSRVRACANKSRSPESMPSASGRTSMRLACAIGSTATTS